MSDDPEQPAEVPTGADAFGKPRDLVPVADAVAASHWDARIWRTDAP
jgi:hypothetical protein